VLVGKVHKWLVRVDSTVPQTPLIYRASFFRHCALQHILFLQSTAILFVIVIVFDSRRHFSPNNSIRKTSLFSNIHVLAFNLFNIVSLSIVLQLLLPDRCTQAWILKLPDCHDDSLRNTPVRDVQRPSSLIV